MKVRRYTYIVSICLHIWWLDGLLQCSNALLTLIYIIDVRYRWYKSVNVQMWCAFQTVTIGKTLCIIWICYNR
jgi:hypothetical protein